MERLINVGSGLDLLTDARGFTRFCLVHRFFFFCIGYTLRIRVGSRRIATTPPSA